MPDQNAGDRLCAQRPRPWTFGTLAGDYAKVWTETLLTPYGAVVIDHVDSF
jgi:hypothetical protein